MKKNGVSACLQSDRRLSDCNPFSTSATLLLPIAIHLIPLPCPLSAPINTVSPNHTCPVSQGSRRLYFEVVPKAWPAWQGIHAFSLFPGLMAAACTVLSILGRRARPTLNPCRTNNATSFKAVSWPVQI